MPWSCLNCASNRQKLRQVYPFPCSNPTLPLPPPGTFSDPDCLPGHPEERFDHKKKLPNRYKIVMLCSCLKHASNEQKMKHVNTFSCSNPALPHHPPWYLFGGGLCPLAPSARNCTSRGAATLASERQGRGAVDTRRKDKGT